MSESADTLDYTAGNRATWQRNAPDYAKSAATDWAGEPKWGIWGTPEADLELLAGVGPGLRCIEIGCGTAYVSAWLARRGADVVGIDPTPAQLATAHAMMRHHNLEFPLVEALGERLPFADDSFDFAISEYGAALWADPYRWIPEASRVLRRGGRLRFLSNAPLLTITLPDNETDKVGTTLLRPYLGLHRVVYLDEPEATEFHLPHGEMIDLLHANNFVLERLREIGAPRGAVTRYAWADADWAQRWPTEDVWYARRV